MSGSGPRRPKIAGALILGWALTLSTVWAQASGAGAAPPGWNGALTRIYEGFQGFSSVADWRALDRAGKETVRLRVGFAKLQERLRLEIDLNQMKSDQLQPQMLAAVKQLGMDRMVVVVTPSRNSMQLIYPGLGAYVDMPLPEETGAGKNLKAVRTRVGEEKIDGRACVKQKTVLQGGAGERVDALEWQAPDLQNFPVQVQIQDGESTVVLRCSEVQLAPPDARQFAPPSNYKKYTDVMKLMEDSARRQMATTGGGSRGTPATNRPATNRPAGQPLRPLTSVTNRPAGTTPARGTAPATNRPAAPKPAR